ncbi:MAG: hypothetical protein Q4P29_04280 [Tissierellia bacterium]|nr:hypothetical protein [Tissierellia bacterium]
MSKERIIIILQVVILFMLILIFNKFYQVDNKIILMEDSISSQISDISRSNSFIMDELKKSNSIIKDAKITYKKFNKENQSLDFDIEVVPKKIDEDTKVYIDFGDEIINLEKDNNSFLYSGEIDITKNLEGKIIVEESGKKFIEPYKKISKNALYKEILPEIVISKGEYSSSYVEKESLYKYNYDYEFEKIVSKNGIGFKSFNYVFEIDGREIKKEPLDNSSDNVVLKLKDTIDLNLDEKIVFYIEAKDELDFIHKFYIDSFISGSDSHPEPFPRDVIIAPNGEVLDSEFDF